MRFSKGAKNGERVDRHAAIVSAGPTHRNTAPKSSTYLQGRGQQVAKI